MHEKIRSHLAEPALCDHCASPNIGFKSNAAIYGKPLGEWPHCWHCSDCGAAVGCHKETRYPLGRMADKKTRQLRKKAHTAFDPLWESQAMTRTEAYYKLAQHLGIEPAYCHIAQLNEVQLKETLLFCAEHTTESAIGALRRRKEKKDAKKYKRIEREKKQNDRFARFTKRNSSVGRARRSK